MRPPDSLAIFNCPQARALQPLPSHPLRFTSRPSSNVTTAFRIARRTTPRCWCWCSSAP